MSIVSGKDLKRRGWPAGKVIGEAKRITRILMRDGADKNTCLDLLESVRKDPEYYLHHDLLGVLAGLWIALLRPQPSSESLRPSPLSFRIWGEKLIDREAINQMETALRLPVARAGALMPDAHVGYGIPIGGVLATENAVIPYAVGVDIACRMRLSVFPEPANVLHGFKDNLIRALTEETHFGVGDTWSLTDTKRPDHRVLEDHRWTATPFLRTLQKKAVTQLGTSGSGNHFVEWGSFTLEYDDDLLQLPAGSYLALLSHSGSRNVGAQIAQRYSRLAKTLHPHLDASASHLSWLEMNSEEGEIYWLSMQLAGDFAHANHEVIHQRVAAAVGLTAVCTVENHHNFAWREVLADGTPVIVHRKGATPASSGLMGIIPGSMADPGYVVRGLGNAASLSSAAHGAGRKMSRKRAKSSISRSSRDEYIHNKGVFLIGGGLDEAPQAYKNIHEVMTSQEDLIEVIGAFMPAIVRMDS